MALIKRRPTDMSDAASDQLASVLARMEAQHVKEDRRKAAIAFQKRNIDSRAAEKIPTSYAKKKGGLPGACWSHPVGPGVSVPAEGVIEVQCLRCEKAWRRRFGEIYYSAYGEGASLRGTCGQVHLKCPNKLCSGNGHVHPDWGTVFRDAEGNPTSFD